MENKMEDGTVHLRKRKICINKIKHKEMQRESKYRAKAIHANEWIYGNLIHSKRFAGHSNEWRIYEPDTGCETDVMPETIGQFIGLYDKNGKEIYEGDVIRATTTHGNVLGEYIIEKSEGLEWSYNGYKLKAISGHGRGKCCNFHPDNIWWAGDTPANWDEVIGNIHDNPELLTNEQSKTD